ncbi:MAG: class I SAM-dependent methyltransferase [Rhizobiaceae bacterium]|nr:class I SAM-dependent methyltransferase [Rhizobiaceae bacterium]MCV0407253.1 class I SAM-dependent methyltransferase [Rhizobiaceae bacterium]
MAETAASAIGHGAASPFDPVERHIEELGRGARLSGAKVLDIGCGTGALVRRLEEAGASAWGVEVDEKMVLAAAVAGPAPDRFLTGTGQSLPFDDHTFDGACYVFSFHHVPAVHQETALAELARVLKPTGWGAIIEPLPFGDMTKVIEPIEDEFEVRTRAHELLSSGRLPRLRLRGVRHYEICRSFASAEEVIANAVKVDPRRATAARDPAVKQDLTARFETLSRPGPNGRRVLAQPCVAFWYSV